MITQSLSTSNPLYPSFHASFLPSTHPSTIPPTLPPSHLPPALPPPVERKRLQANRADALAPMNPRSMLQAVIAIASTGDELANADAPVGSLPKVKS